MLIREFSVYFIRKEIEAVLGNQIQWERADESRYSKVCILLPEVSITNEDDWKMMAKFHAEWSRKFCDVLIPYATQSNP